MSKVETAAVFSRRVGYRIFFVVTELARLENMPLTLAKFAVLWYYIVR